MPYPEVPFEAVVSNGAVAYSPDGQREWGTIGSMTVQVIALFGNFARIDTPKWVNGKNWCVEQRTITPVSPPPPPPPPPDPDPITITHAVVYLSDGTQKELRPV